MRSPRVTFLSLRCALAAFAAAAAAGCSDTLRPVPDDALVPIATVSLAQRDTSPTMVAHMYGCDLSALSADLAPGDTLASGAFRLEVPLIEIVGDSLPDGRFWFSAYVETNRTYRTRVAAGSLDIVVPRPPLLESRFVESLRFIALPVALSGMASPSITARGSIRVDFAGSAMFTTSRDCPMRLLAYRDRARRDAAPRSGAPDWSQPLTCSTAQDTARLNRGQSRTFQATVPVTDILGSQLPGGRYYFAVVMLGAGARVYLSAGDAELTR
ncbi:MAG: hypothetical protein ACYC4J_08175 [Gemmatimonadaceae bacterium]